MFTPNITKEPIPMQPETPDMYTQQIRFEHGGTHFVMKWVSDLHNVWVRQVEVEYNDFDGQGWQQMSDNKVSSTVIHNSKQNAS